MPEAKQEEKTRCTGVAPGGLRCGRYEGHEGAHSPVYESGAPWIYKGPQDLRWEEAAVRLENIQGWVCVRCRRYHGDHPGAEDSARWCCHTDAPCKECGGRNVNKSYTCCADCREKNDDARWLALPRVAWDGETPLNLWGDDRYFYGPEDLANYLDDGDPDDPPRRIEDLRLVVCYIVAKRELDLGDYLFDDCGEDFDPSDHGGDEIEKIVNDWINALPPVWYGTSNAVSLESLREHLGPYLEDALSGRERPADAP